MLNVLWPIFIIISFIYAIFTGQIEKVNAQIFNSTKSTIELTLTLLGTICLWSGIMKIATETSLIKKLEKLLNPIMKKIFPEIRKRRGSTKRNVHKYYC